MATHTGSSGLIKVGTNTVAEVRSFTLDTTAELLEDTALTDTSKTFQVGKKGATASVECFWDETDTNGQIAIAEGEQVTLYLYPEGATSGDYYFAGTWIISANSVSTPTDGMIEATFSATLTGALTRGTV